MKQTKRFFLPLALIISLLFSSIFTSIVHAAPNNLVVSGTVTPKGSPDYSGVTGTYTYVDNNNNGHNYWSHTDGGLTYYIYYNGSPYNDWEIFTELNNADYLFYATFVTDPPEAGLVWTPNPVHYDSATISVNDPTILEPEINILGNGTSIADGSIYPNVGNYTRFVSTNISSETQTRTYTISNPGTAALTISGITIEGTDKADFSVTPPLTTSIAPSSSTTFTVTFDPTTVGKKTATIVVANNDTSEASYDFSIDGYGFSPQDLVVTGITTPAAANTSYTHKGVLNNYEYWMSTDGYYIYTDGVYWFLDNNTDSSLANGVDFFSNCSFTPSILDATNWEGSPSAGTRGTGMPVIAASAPTPNINVKGNGTAIALNDVTPSFTDSTKYGSINISSGSRSRTYTIENAGGAPLTISGITVGGTDAADFVKTDPVLTTVPAYSSTTFSIAFDPTTVGTKTATVSIASNDPDENPYPFTISGDAFTPKNLIVSDITSPADANGTYVYQNIKNEFQIWKHETKNYYIYNNVYLNSNYWNIDTDDTSTSTSDFLFTRSSDNIAPVGLTGWTIGNVVPGTAGSPTIIYSGPEMDVKGNGTSIADGSSTPATSNHTDFGSVDVASGTASRTYTISNTGGVDLTLGGTPKVAISGTNAGDFSVTTQPTSPVVAATGSATFTVEFNPSGTGTRSATISIANNDTDENPYDFSIQGTGTSTPLMEVSGKSVTIVNGDPSPSTTDDTDFGTLGITASPVEHTFTITNSGSAALNLTGSSPYVTVTGSDFTVTGTPSGNITAGGGTTTFKISFDPSTPGTKSSNVSIANDDPADNPYIFRIEGEAVSAPVLTTTSAMAVTGSGATLGGNITSDGGASVSGRGVVYSTSNTNPEIGGTNVTQDTNGTGAGAFNEPITGLATATHYYYQAYATNSEGTTYGGVQEFTTLNAITSINRAGSSPTKASSVSWTVEFGAALTGLSTSNFSLVSSGLTGPAITGVTGSGTTWTVTASTGTGSGTLGLNFVNSAGLSQSIGNTLPFSGQTYTIDKIAPSAPTITGISSGIFNSNQTFTVSGEAGATIEYTTNLGGLWTVYSGPVTLSAEGTYKIVACQKDQAGNGPTATSIYTITIDKTAPSAPTISGISAGYFNSNQTFTVSGEAGNTIEYSTNNGGLWTAYSGAVTLSAEGTYNVLTRQTDQAGNGPVTSSVITLTIDKTAPTVEIIQAAGQADPAGSSPVNFTITFSENVTGFATGDVDLSVSTAPGTLTGTVSGGPAVYNVAVSGMTGDGVIIALIAAGVAQDAAGNASTVFSTADNSVTYDAVSPGVTINQTSGQVDPTNAGPIHFTVVFTERVTGFAAGDVTLTSALAGLTQTIKETAPMNGTTFDVSVGGLSGGGTVTASIAAGVAMDAAAHGNTASTSTDNTVTFDAAAPVTTINTHPASSTTSTSAAFTFSATDAGTGVAGYQCQMDGGGFSACTSPRNYTGLSGGSHSFMVRATDAIGNIETPPQIFNWTVDATAPVVTAFTVTSPSTSRNIPVTTFTATDDIGVTGFMMTQSSTAPAAGSKSWAGSAPAYFNVIADGTYTVYPWVKDAAGRVSAVFSTPRTIIVDSTAPTVTINQASGQADPVKAGPVMFRAVFSEPVTGFDASDVNITASTAPGAAIGTVTGGPTTYTITATATGEGAIVVSIPAGSAQDATTNTNTASTSTDNSVTLDSTAPNVTNVGVAPSPTNAGTTFSWNADENGTFTIRVLAYSCSSGTQIANGTYSTSPATIDTVIPAANLPAGPNTLLLCLTDAAGNTGSVMGGYVKNLNPIVTTNAATPVGNTTATLRGTVNANSYTSDVSFEYGLTNAYGTTVNASPASVTGSSNTNVSAAITGLTANTTYHYRVTATNSDGTTNGLDQTFTTNDLTIIITFHDATHAVVTSATPGTSLHASAAVTHTNPAAPTGSLVFTRYNNVTCTGAGAAAGTLAVAATVDPSQSTALTDNGLSFKARFSGDSNYPAVESPCARISSTTDLSILPLSTGTSPRDGITVSGGMNNLIVQFNSDVLHNNAADGHSVLNTANFLLVSRGANNVFDTVNCAGGVVADDALVTVDSVSYNAATYTATVNVNGGTRLPVGYYRLFVCGTTSITDPAGAIFLNGHADDSRISFRVASGSGSSSGSSSDPDETENIKRLPATGFAPGNVTILPDQPTIYTEADNLRLEIPRLGVDTSIVGVPVSNDGDAWDVTWLGGDAGWLNGTAFPSFAGNSVITGHVWDADNQPGIFVNLKDMAYGDKIIVHAYGWAYTYEVRATGTVAPDEVKGVIQHEDNPWVTLVTCEDYLPGTTEYASRRVVRAVLVNVVQE